MGGIHYTNTSITQKCALCQEKHLTCTVIRTRKGKFKLCGPCASQKIKCGVIQDFPTIIDCEGNVIHPVKSWPHLISHPQKDSQRGIKPNSEAKQQSRVKTLTKSKQKAQAKGENDRYPDADANGKWVAEGKGTKTSKKSKSIKGKQKAWMEDEEEPKGKWVSEGEARTVGTNGFRNSMITDPIVRLTLGPPADPGPRDMQSCQ